MHGEKPVKSFFDKFRNKKEHKPIRCLKNDNSQDVFDTQGILKIVEKFYINLFTPREIRQSVVNLFFEHYS